MADGIYYNPEPQLTVEAKSVDNISVSATSSADGSFSVAKSGYTPIGIVGWRIQNATSSGAYYTRIFAWRLELSGATLYYGLGNYYSSAAKIKLTANVLYRKN